MSQPVIIGTGSCLPDRLLTNAELERMVDTSDEWITSRTGIHTRRIAGRGEETSKLAARATGQALQMAGLTPAELDLIIVGTITAEMIMPACACLVQKELEAANAFAFDVNAACSGFLYSLQVADRYVRTDPGMKIAVIGAETLSSRVNWQDRNTCVLFGDAAGACIVTGGDSGHHRILASRMYSDGRLWRLLSLGGASGHNPHLDNAKSEGAYIRMTGRDVFRLAVKAMEDAVVSLLARERVPIDRIALVIPHQANVRILKALAERLELPFEKVYTTIQKYGNTSAASIPVALDEANREGRLREGDLVLLCAFGGGFTWGATLIQW